MIVEDLDAFLRDFGVPCSRGAQQFVAIHDQPQDLIGVGEIGVISTHESILYRSEVALAYGDAIIVDGVAYVVQEIRALDDGRFTDARIGTP